MSTSKEVLGEWVRLIEMKEEDLKYYRKEKNTYMTDLTEEVLKAMKEKYAKLSKTIKTD